MGPTFTKNDVSIIAAVNNESSKWFYRLPERDNSNNHAIIDKFFDKKKTRERGYIYKIHKRTGTGDIHFITLGGCNFTGTPQKLLFHWSLGLTMRQYDRMNGTEIN